MVKKYLKRWSPDPDTLQKNPNLRFLGRLIHNPHLFHLTRHSVSMAFLVGFIICFLPIPVGHILFAAIGCIGLRCNFPIAFILVMISNPLTFPFIYSAAYVVGSWVLQTPLIDFQFEATETWFKETFLSIWKPFVIGCFIFGISSGVGSYFLIQGVWRWHVIKRWRNRRRKSLPK